MTHALRPHSIRRWIVSLVVVIALLGDAVASDAPLAPGFQPCPDDRVWVLAANPEDGHDACSGAQGAMAFFAAHGIHPSAPLTIEVTARIPEEAGPTAVGCYLERRDRIFMVPYVEFRKNETWFNLPVGRALYRSLAAHEAAHAVAACNFKIKNPTIQAKEYLAYVAMFATMSADLRERALKSIPAERFAGDERITPLLYMFDPMRFGAESYRHYRRPENGATFLQTVLEGEALAD